MSVTSINIGNFVNDGLGDDLRTAFQKVNANFTSLSNEIAVIGQNIGTGAGIYKQKTAYKLELKSITHGSNVTVTENANDIQIDSPLQNNITRIITDNGNLDIINPSTAITFQSGNNMAITKNGNTVRFDAALVTTQLENDLDLNGYSITGFGNINLNNYIPTVLGTGVVSAPSALFGTFNGVGADDLVSGVFDYSFGPINLANGFRTTTEFLFSQLEWDFGSVTNAADTVLDLGTII
jgi:hypothetical protein